MKKSRGIIVLILMLAVTVFFGWLAIGGVQKDLREKSASSEEQFIRKGLDLSGGLSITYQTKDANPNSEDLADTIYKLQKRVETYSTEAQVYQEGSNRINVEIPGVTADKPSETKDTAAEDTAAAEEAAAAEDTAAEDTAEDAAEPADTAAEDTADDAAAEDAAESADTAAENKDISLSQAERILQDLGTPGSLCFITMTGDDGVSNFSYTGKTESGYEMTRTLDEIREAGSVVLDGTDVADAQGGAITDQTTSAMQYVVSLTLTDEGSKKFAEATAANVGKQIAIIYDNGVVSAPRVNEAIGGGQAQITGMSTLEEARNLASYIRIGSLSLELEEIRSSIVAAQLGEEAISTSLRAALIGLIIVIIIMIIAYKVPGIVASWALLLYLFLNLLLINQFEITLTLPGIAGIILGIGMAVDANVIIYARIKEEIGAGVSVRNAIKSGFSKAFSAIFDGNITTLIAALVLMRLGSGTVKGFAYTLTLSIILSMFTALAVSRLLINAFYAVGARDEKLYGKVIAREPINFVGRKKTFFIISLVLILLGPAFMAINSGMGKNAFNYSLEFSGGTSTNVTFNENMDIKRLDAEVVPVVEEVTGDKNVQITKDTQSNQVIIKTRSLSLEEREVLNQALVDNFGVDRNLISAEFISATVSSEMRRDAIIAVIVATICMLIYIWFRFKDIRFAGSAVLALLHDVLVVLAFYAIARVSVGNTFIACMLTIVGYSINATIVIFDRIREHIRGTVRVTNLDDIVNQSITETLTRSIYTSLTTFVMVAVLYIMGVSSIREFAAPLMVGIIVGAYSSVCITGALWLVLRKKFPGRTAEAQAAAKAASVVKEASPKKTRTPKSTEPKKKNRKRVAERLAREEAEKNNQD